MFFSQLPTSCIVRSENSTARFASILTISPVSPSCLPAITFTWSPTLKCLRSSLAWNSRGSWERWNSKHSHFRTSYIIPKDLCMPNVLAVLSHSVRTYSSLISNLKVVFMEIIIVQALWQRAIDFTRSNKWMGPIYEISYFSMKVVSNSRTWEYSKLDAESLACRKSCTQSRAGPLLSSGAASHPGSQPGHALLASYPNCSLAWAWG